MRLNKRAVSMMVSYALLVVIGIAVAAISYPYLKSIVTPPDFAECPPDMSLSIEEAACNRADWSVSVRLLNRGLFNVTGAFIRFAHENRTVRDQINRDREIFIKGTSDTSPLAPGQETAYVTYQVGSLGYLPENGSFILEVQPAVYKKGVLVPCSGKIITQSIECISTMIGWLFQDEPSPIDEFSCEGDWDDANGRGCSNIHDTLWNTPATAAPGSIATFRVNYTIAPNYKWPESNWSGMWRNNEYFSYLSFSHCWDYPAQDKIQFTVEINRQASPGYIALSCYDYALNGGLGDWRELAREGDENQFYNLLFYEEGMWWQESS
ncbi:MAG: hypothetical protein KKD18_04510 [Nanoarchaeota archaeon]|nr:hypothetical protein [Nanoarchaeota archaeon]MBU0977653.1 hypothetical protein [Nanoarchaeota archaeon]